MNVLQEMKEAKLSYLADVMSDYAKWLSETSSDQHIADNIAEWASTIREVLTMTDGHFVIEKTLDIRRLENKMKLSVPFFCQGIPNYQDENLESAKRVVEDNLLHYIKKNKLIEVKVGDDGHGIPIASASLYVGIRPQIHLPQSPHEP
jgi:hypothetical protein